MFTIVAILRRKMAGCRLMMILWTFLCLCQQDSQCVQIVPMCDNALFSTSTHTSTPKVSEGMEGVSSQTHFLVLSNRPSKDPGDTRLTTKVKRSNSNSVLTTVVKRGKGNKTSAPHFQTATTTAPSQNGKGAPRRSPSTPHIPSTSSATGPTTTTYGGVTTPSQVWPHCSCEIATAARFSLYVLDESPYPEASGQLLHIADDCSNSTYSLEDLKSGPVLNFNNTTKDMLCHNKSDSVISIRVTTHRTLRLLLTFEGGTDDLKVRCSSQSSRQPSDQGQHLPNVMVIPREGVNNKTGDVTRREKPGPRVTRPSGVSTWALQLMILSFICLILLMLATAFFLLWRRSNLDHKGSIRRRKTRQRKEEQEINNYEEISELYSRHTSQSERDTKPKSTNPRSQRQGSTGSIRKTERYSTSPHVQNDDYRQSRASSLEREHSLPGGGDALTLEYSTAKDSLTTRPRPQMSIPGIVTSRDVGLASYEDLPYRHQPRTQISLAAGKSALVTRSTPEIPFACRCSHHERSTSVPRLPTVGLQSLRPKRGWLSGDSTQNDTYFELMRSYNSVSLDASKVALYESMLNTNNVSCGSFCSNVCGTGGRGSHFADRPRSIRGFSEGSISKQSGECSTSEKYPTYEDITSGDIRAKRVIDETPGIEKNAAGDGVEKKDRHDRPPLKPRALKHSDPCIIDLSEFNRSPKSYKPTKPSPPSVELQSNALNTGCCQNPNSHTLSEDGSEQFLPSREATIQDNHDKIHHNDDDGVVMIENDIYRSCRSNLQGGEGQSKPGPIKAGKDADSGITLNDNDHDYIDDESPSDGCHNTLKTTPSGESTMPGDKNHNHEAMSINNDFNQSSGKVGRGLNVTSGRPLADTTTCYACDGHLVMEENIIYQSTCV